MRGYTSNMQRNQSQFDQSNSSNIIGSRRLNNKDLSKNQSYFAKNDHEATMNSRDLSGGSSKMYRTFSNHYKKGSTYEMFLNLGGGKSNYGMAQKYSGMTMGNRPSSRSGSTRRKTSTARSKSRYNHAPKKNEPMDDIKGNLKKIFEFYVSFGERMNLKYMKSNKFLKLMQDTAIPLDKTTLDLLFVVENKHRSNMDFEIFLNLLPKLAVLIYRDSEEQKTPKEALMLMLETYFNPLHDMIMKETHMGSMKN